MWIIIQATEAKQLSRAAPLLLFTRLGFATKPNGHLFARCDRQRLIDELIFLE
jgi:hypothetical protein